MPERRGDQGEGGSAKWLFGSTGDVLKACRRSDDLPTVLVTGCGPLHEARASANAALEEIARALAETGRLVVLAASALDPDLAQRIKHASAFDTSGMHAFRQVCVVRDVDLAPPETVYALCDAAFESHARWWIASAGGLARAHQRFKSGAMVVRARGAEELVRKSVRRIRIRSRADVGLAVRSGAPADVITAAFWDFASQALGDRAGAEAASRLDLNIKRNRRPLFLTLLVEHAVDDVERAAEAQKSSTGGDPESSSPSEVQ